MVEYGKMKKLSKMATAGAEKAVSKLKPTPTTVASGTGGTQHQRSESGASVHSQPNGEVCSVMTKSR